MGKVWSLVILSVAFIIGCGDKNEKVIEQEIQGVALRDESHFEKGIPDTVRAVKYCITQDGFGMGGYDPVSYFEGEPQKGTKDYWYEVEGVIYLFSTSQNMERFIHDPRSYLPEYGGWCGLALSEGKLHKPDYQNYMVQDGTLYVFSANYVKDPKVWTYSGDKRKKAKNNYIKFVLESF